jgi:uncharacterized membrane protein YfcA
MAHEFTYELSDDLSRKAMRRFMLHHVNWRVRAAFIVCAVLVSLICASEESGYICGIFAGALGVLAIVLALAFALRNRKSRELLRKLESRAARCTLTEDEMRLQSELGTSTLKWRMLEKVVRGPDVWLFFVGKLQNFALPAEKLAGEPGRFIERRIGAAGGKIV